jgi:hypothetical protein
MDIFAVFGFPQTTIMVVVLGDNLQQIFIRPLDADGVGDFVPDKVLKKREFIAIGLKFESIHFSSFSRQAPPGRYFLSAPAQAGRR